MFRILAKFVFLRIREYNEKLTFYIGYTQRHMSVNIFQKY